MSFSPVARIILSLILLVSTLTAFETDQYNLPPVPLSDIGDEFTQYVEQNLRKAVERVNTKISEAQLCLDNKNSKSLKCDSPKKVKSKLDFLQTEDAVAGELYNLLGTGFPPLTRSGSWIESHRFKAEPARYKTTYGNSPFLTAPFNYITISSTVKMYDSEFGTDKIAHFFQQGYTYFQVYKRALKANLKPEEANKKAIKWGQSTERTYYGTLVSGVYSNGDLFANYIGMRFYQGLAREIAIGENKRPAIVLFENRVWKVNETIDLKEVLIKPFISDHLNEALNSSSFMEAFGFRSVVRRIIRKKTCRQWRERFPDLSQTELNRNTQALKLWHGEDYGFTDSKHFVTIAETCFDENGNFVQITK